MQILFGFGPESGLHLLSGSCRPSAHQPISQPPLVCKNTNNGICQTILKGYRPDNKVARGQGGKGGANNNVASHGNALCVPTKATKTNISKVQKVLPKKKKKQTNTHSLVAKIWLELWSPGCACPATIMRNIPLIFIFRLMSIGLWERTF